MPMPAPPKNFTPMTLEERRRKQEEAVAKIERAAEERAAREAFVEPDIPDGPPEVKHSFFPKLEPPAEEPLQEPPGAVGEVSEPSEGVVGIENAAEANPGPSVAVSEVVQGKLQPITWDALDEIVPLVEPPVTARPLLYGKLAESISRAPGEINEALIIKLITYMPQGMHIAWKFFCFERNISMSRGMQVLIQRALDKKSFEA